MQATHHRLAALALAGFSMLVAADDDVDGSFEDGSGSVFLLNYVTAQI